IKFEPNGIFWESVLTTTVNTASNFVRTLNKSHNSNLTRWSVTTSITLTINIQTGMKNYFKQKLIVSLILHTVFVGQNLHPSFYNGIVSIVFCCTVIYET
uniref:Uncharacterized protein n=1 Tax=Ciona intestinalis TaxID=7719 RepID=F6T628_CIOIN